MKLTNVTIDNLYNGTESTLNNDTIFYFLCFTAKIKGILHFFWGKWAHFTTPPVLQFLKRISVTRQFLVSLTSIVGKTYTMEVNETRNCLVTDILLNIKKSAEWIRLTIAIYVRGQNEPIPKKSGVSL